MSKKLVYVFFFEKKYLAHGGQITSFKQKKIGFRNGLFILLLFKKKIKIIKSISRDLKVLTKTETKNNIKRFLTYKILCSHAKTLFVFIFLYHLQN